jgi:glycosyltransferase involved in cell wall biosynthesis
MKIIINAFQYAPTITGTDRMAHNFLLELQKIDTENRYIVICSNESYNRSSLTNRNFKIIAPLKLPASKLLQRIYNKLWRVTLPLRLKLLNADCYFSFHNMSLPPISIAKRMIVFNLDLIPLVLPGYESIHGKSKEELKDEYKKIARRANHFISISEFSKNELCQELGVDKNKVSVIHLAINEGFTKDTELKNPLLSTGRYILTIGGTEPRKNVATVVESFSKLPQNLQEEFPLAIIGGEWHGISLDAFRQTPNVLCLGYVPEEELSGLYKNARAFIFASEYEGFGFTILEAMASGVPVITSTSSSLAEVAGNGALLFDAHDTDQLSDHIKTLLTDPTVSTRLIELGNQRVNEFSWSDAARKLHSIIGKPFDQDL